MGYIAPEGQGRFRLEEIVLAGDWTLSVDDRAKTEMLVRSFEEMAREGA